MSGPDWGKRQTVFKSFRWSYCYQPVAGSMDDRAAVEVFIPIFTLVELQPFHS